MPTRAVGSALPARPGLPLPSAGRAATGGLDGALLTVPVDPRGTTWSAGTATKLFAGRYFTGADSSRQYDVSPDGQRFLMIKEAGATNQTATPPQVIVVQHWTEELKRLVPTK